MLQVFSMPKADGAKGNVLLLTDRKVRAGQPEVFNINTGEKKDGIIYRSGSRRPGTFDDQREKDHRQRGRHHLCMPGLFLPLPPVHWDYKYGPPLLTLTTQMMEPAQEAIFTLKVMIIFPEEPATATLWLSEY